MKNLSTWDVVLGLLYFFGIIFIQSFFISRHQRKLAKTQIDELGIPLDKKIPIKLQSELIGTFRNGITSTAKVDMYFMEDYLFISPGLEKTREGGSGEALPIIFTKDVKTQKLKTKINNVVTPDYIQVWDTGHIEIKFTRNPLDEARTYLYIDVIDQEKFEVLTRIKDWWSS